MTADGVLHEVAGPGATGTGRWPDGLLAEAGSLLDDVVALRRDLHRRPELGLDLPETQARVLDALDGLPLRITTGDGGDGTDGGEPVSWAFAAHQSPSFPSGMVATRPGPLMASADDMHVTLRGRGGHASMPHHANDPIPVACEIVQALQTWVTRRVDAFTPAVITVGRIRAGTTTNVIPETAHIDGTIRTVAPRVRDEAHAAVRRIAEHVAAAHEMTAEVALGVGYPVTVNDGDAANEVLDVARRLVGEDKAFAMPSPVMGAEDFSFILERVPGAMAFLGTRPPGVHPRDVAPNHSNRMVVDESALAAGVALYAATALARLAG